MYSDQVKTLTLDKTPIIISILDANGREIEISRDYMVQDWFYKLPNNVIGAPDYGISGYFRQENKFMRSVFIIQDNGPDKLYVTGFKLGDPNKDRFRLMSSIYITYFQDKEYGYYFQVV